MACGKPGAYKTALSGRPFLSPHQPMQYMVRIQVANGSRSQSQSSERKHLNIRKDQRIGDLEKSQMLCSKVAFRGLVPHFGLTVAEKGSKQQPAPDQQGVTSCLGCGKKNHVSTPEQASFRLSSTNDAGRQNTDGDNTNRTSLQDDATAWMEKAEKAYQACVM